MSSTVPTSSRHRLDLNSADLAELAKVPGLNTALAQRIIAHRPFRLLKELLHVEGIEPEVFERSAPHLKVVLSRDEVRPPVKSPPAAPALSRDARQRPQAQSTPASAAPSAAARPSAPAPTPPVTHTAPPLSRATLAEPLASVPPRGAAWEEVVHAPEVIVVEPGPNAERHLMPTAAPSRAVALGPVAAASAALFESYAGPRIVFALFSLTVALLFIGLFTGRLSFSSRPAAAPADTSALPSPALIDTQVSAAVAATLSVLPSPTAPLPTVRPAPTEAPRPTITSSAVPSPTQSFASNAGLQDTGALIFNETFVPPGYWNVGENEFSNIFIEAGQLTIRMKLSGVIAWAVNTYSAQDFYYQGTAHVRDCRAGDYYGLMYRTESDNDLYLFGISCDGRFRVVRRAGGAFKFLVDFTFTPQATSGSDATNLLAVRAQGTQMSFFVNDQFLTRIEDAGGGPGYFGVFAKSAETQDLQVDFDDLSAWQLSP